MLVFDNDKSLDWVEEHKEKYLEIVTIPDLGFIEWDAVIEGFINIASKLNGYNMVPSKILMEQFMTAEFRQALFEEVPILKRVEAVLCRAARARKHLIHIKHIGLRQRPVEEQAIGFMAISLTIGVPLAADKPTGKVIWDVKSQEGKTSPYQTFSEGTGQADYHTDTAFYERPVRYFGLYCRKPADCGGGVNRFLQCRCPAAKACWRPEKLLDCGNLE